LKKRDATKARRGRDINRFTRVAAAIAALRRTIDG
jgi:hypothetical protein